MKKVNHEYTRMNTKGIKHGRFHLAWIGFASVLTGEKSVEVFSDLCLLVFIRGLSAV